MFLLNSAATGRHPVNQAGGLTWAIWDPYVLQTDTQQKLPRPGLSALPPSHNKLKTKDKFL